MSLISADSEQVATRNDRKRLGQGNSGEAIMAFQGQDQEGKNQSEEPGVRDGSVCQFGGDASTGLGYCTVWLA